VLKSWVPEDGSYLLANFLMRAIQEPEQSFGINAAGNTAAVKGRPVPVQKPLGNLGAHNAKSFFDLGQSPAYFHAWPLLGAFVSGLRQFHPKFDQRAALLRRQIRTQRSGSFATASEAGWV